MEKIRIRFVFMHPAFKGAGGRSSEYFSGADLMVVQTL